MEEGDLSFVVEIERQSQLLPWPRWYFLRCLRGGLSCWALEKDGRVVGYGIMRLKRGWAHVMNLAVAERYRGRGLGRGILSHLLSTARTQGFTRGWLEVNRSNRRAIRLYEQMGFRRKYRHRGYYPTPMGRQDALVMVCRL